MENFCIDFEGFAEIEAESKEEAEQKFWEKMKNPDNDIFYIIQRMDIERY